jgi:hypothetical protein
MFQGTYSLQFFIRIFLKESTKEGKCLASLPIDIDKIMKILIDNTIRPISHCSLMCPFREVGIGGWMDFIFGLDAVAKGTVSDSTRNRTSVVQAIVHSIYRLIYNAFF